MKQHLHRYLKHLEAEGRLSPFTIRNYREDLEAFLKYLMEQGIQWLGEVDRPLLRSYLARLAAQKTARGSMARKVSAIRSFYRWLVREEVLELNPLTNFTPPKRQRRLPSFLRPTEMARLLQSPDPATPQGIRDRALLELLYAAGLRVSEIVSLDLTDVDLTRREVRVWGKGAKQRIVLLGRPAVAALERYLEAGRPKLQGKERSQALFLNRFGGRLSERALQSSLRKYAAKAGIERGVHPHLLRHTFATHLLDGGADLRVVQELLGHTSLGSTQIYTHVSQAEMRRHYLAAHPRGRIKPEEK